MKYYAGFDCGGSSTRCMLVQEDGTVLGRGEGGPSNYLFCGKEVGARSIRDSLNGAIAESAVDVDLSELDGMFIASAAIEVFEGEAHADFFREVTGCSSVSCDSDIFPLWFAGTTEDPFSPAVCMIAGTGSVTYFLEKSRFLKAGGWGPLFGDEGSGYDIGQKALHLVSKMADQRVPMDREFFEAVYAHFEVSPSTPHRLLRSVNQGDVRSRMASVTRVADALCQSGNPSAEALFDEAACELFESVRAVLLQAEADPLLSKLDLSSEPLPLIVSGGLLREGSPLFARLQEKVSAISGISDLRQIQVDAVQSAAAIALYRNGHLSGARRLIS